MTHDILKRDEWDRQAWEYLVMAALAHRQLTANEVECLDENAVRAAYAYGLTSREAAEQRITNIHDEARERAWYTEM